MPATRATSVAPTLISAADRGRLAEHVRRAAERARRGGAPVLAGITVRLAGPLDPTGVVIACRRAGEPWTCLEQPDRGGFALAGAGAALTLEASGPDRFAELSIRWKRAVAESVVDPPEGPAGSGLVALGGFAFAPEGGASPAWTGFAPGSLVVPEVTLMRRDGVTHLSLTVDVAPDDDPDAVTDRLGRRVEAMREAELPLLDPAPVTRCRVLSPMPPSHYEQAVRGAVDRIRRGEIEKVVLARTVEVHAPAAHDVAAVLGVLREAFRSCFVFAVGRGDGAFVAASPELLLRREGARLSTVALAGSARRSADPAVDAHLGEQLRSSEKDREENAIVVRRIVRALRPHAVWVTATPEPEVVQVANIQHLATPIRAQLTGGAGVIDLAGALHPTPAVGGEPEADAVSLIPALEGLDRGWYAGAIGWADAAQDGEFCVGLRCALLRGRLATLYSGAGIVRDSDPAAELAETEMKLGALLPVLAG